VKFEQVWVTPDAREPLPARIENPERCLQPFAKPTGSYTKDEGKKRADERKDQLPRKSHREAPILPPTFKCVRNLDFLTTDFTIAPKILLFLYNSMSGTSASSDTGLPSNVGAGLCAIFPLIGGIIFYFIEKKDSFVRHWAVQSIYFGVSTFVLFFALMIVLQIFAHIPLIGWIFAILLGLLVFVFYIGYFILWIMGIIKAFTGQRWEYPYLTPLWKKWFPNLTA
jgi:uncharacterized membrane protein